MIHNSVFAIWRVTRTTCLTPSRASTHTACGSASIESRDYVSFIFAMLSARSWPNSSSVLSSSVIRDS